MTSSVELKKVMYRKNLSAHKAIDAAYYKLQSLQKLLYEYLIRRLLLLIPCVAEAIKIGLTLPATTRSIGRTFSTLRRLETSNRSTMSHEAIRTLYV